LHVDVDQKELVKKLPEHLMDEVLKYGEGVDQAIRHHTILVVSSSGYEGCFPLVPLTYSDEIVGAAEVQLGEYSGTAEVFQSRWDEGKWIAELYSYFVVSPVVYTRPKPPSFLTMKKKLEAAGEVDGRMYPCCRASSIYSSMAFSSGIDNGYIFPWGTDSPGSRSMAQSHGRCGGSLEALFGQKTSLDILYWTLDGGRNWLQLSWFQWQ